MSRIVGGVGGGIIFTAVPLYVGEIAEVNKPNNHYLQLQMLT